MARRESDPQCGGSVEVMVLLPSRYTCYQLWAGSEAADVQCQAAWRHLVWSRWVFCTNSFSIAAFLLPRPWRDS